MSTVKISPSGQVRIPKDVMEAMNAQAGDYLDFVVGERGVSVKAKKLVDADQAWFWQKGWQDAEREAEEDIKAGRVSKKFSTPAEGIEHLKKLRKSSRAKKPA